ncbi:hypothetical protein ACIRF8_08800 [Streptomyces sp. NPDC102406]
MWDQEDRTGPEGDEETETKIALGPLALFLVAVLAAFTVIPH